MMATTFVFCAECNQSQTVTTTLNVSIDTTRKPETLTVTGIQQTFSCDHIQIVWDNPS